MLAIKTIQVIECQIAGGVRVGLSEAAVIRVINYRQDKKVCDVFNDDQNITNASNITKCDTEYQYMEVNTICFLKLSIKNCNESDDVT